MTAIILGGIGLVGVGVGGYFGVRARSLWSDSDDACPNGKCNADGAALAEDAGRKADLSTGAFVLSGLFLTTAGVLWFSAPSSAPTTTGSLWTAPGSAGFSVRSRF